MSISRNDPTGCVFDGREDGTVEIESGPMARLALCRSCRVEYHGDIPASQQPCIACVDEDATTSRGLCGGCASAEQEELERDERDVFAQGVLS